MVQSRPLRLSSHKGRRLLRLWLGCRWATDMTQCDLDVPSPGQPTAVSLRSGASIRRMGEQVCSRESRVGVGREEGARCRPNTDYDLIVDHHPARSARHRHRRFACARRLLPSRSFRQGGCACQYAGSCAGGEPVALPARTACATHATAARTRQRRHRWQRRQGCTPMTDNAGPRTRPAHHDDVRSAVRRLHRIYGKT